MKNKIIETPSKGEIIIYKAKDRKIQLEVKLEQETVWLSQEQIASLFKTERSVITKHLGNIFRSNELDEKSNVQKLHIAFSDKPVKFYKLDAIISIGYRVNSSRATQFRIWATNILKRHLIDGYTLNEKRLKEKTQKLQALQKAVKLITSMKDRKQLKAGEKSMENRLKKLNQDIQFMFHHIDLFKKLNEIISNNQSLKKMDGTLLAWIKKASTVDLVMGIGCICDKDNRTNSLVMFLKYLKNNQHYLTRERYVKLYKSSDKTMLELANRDFDNLAGADQDIFSETIIQSDIKKITENELFEKVLTYRHQYVAHSDQNQSEAIPSYDELFQAFKIVEEILKKYNLLLLATSFSEMTPMIQGNWMEVLTIPWLEEKVNL